MSPASLNIVLFITAIPCINGQLRVSLQRQELPINQNIPKATRGLHLLEQVPEILKNYQNVYYYGEVTLGTPGDKVRVVFDTGSPSLWVYSGSGWRSWICLPCWFHKTYHHSRSSTYVAIGKPVRINYVSGYMEGYSSQDVLSIGNLSVPVVFGEAVSAPLSTSKSEKFDGILGLGPCSGLGCPVYRDLTEPVIHSILSLLPNQLFSVYLDRSGKKDGEITFGGTNPDLYYEDSLKMHPTSKPYTWSVRIDSVWVGDKMVLDYSQSFTEAYVDTGTSLIVGPPLDVTKILNEVGIPFGLQVVCGRIPYLPSITFVIGGENYTLSSQDYASMRTKPIWGNEICYHGLEGLFVASKSWILGDVFMGKFYSVFEVQNGRASRIGFGKLKERV